MDWKCCSVFLEGWSWMRGLTKDLTSRPWHGHIQQNAKGAGEGILSIFHIHHLSYLHLFICLFVCVSVTVITRAFPIQCVFKTLGTYSYLGYTPFPQYKYILNIWIELNWIGQINKGLLFSHSQRIPWKENYKCLYSISVPL